MTTPEDIVQTLCNRAVIFLDATRKGHHEIARYQLQRMVKLNADLRKTTPLTTEDCKRLGDRFEDAMSDSDGQVQVHDTIIALNGFFSIDALAERVLW